MKIAVMVRQLDLGHILWCGRVVRVERAHRVRVVRGVQKMPDVGNGHHRAGWRQELSGTIAQCLKLEHEIHDTVSKLCILGFEPLK